MRPLREARDEWRSQVQAAPPARGFGMVRPSGRVEEREGDTEHGDGPPPMDLEVGRGSGPLSGEAGVR
jgi:hypothetical protein